MAVSAGTRDSVCDIGVPADKVVVVPNAVRPDEIRFRPEGRKSVRAELGIPGDAFVVGCISRLHPKKRNDVVVEAVGMLDGRTHLIMAGDGETEAALREQAQILGDRAHFIPTPGDDTIAAVLSAFDVSVFCPSPTEGAPRAVILGMLAERPCIATGAEGVADMIDVSIGGITIPENDSQALRGARPVVPGGFATGRQAGRRGPAPRRGALRPPGRGQADRGPRQNGQPSSPPLRRLADSKSDPCREPRDRCRAAAPGPAAGSAEPERAPEPER